MHRIETISPTQPLMLALLEEHLEDMYATSPPDSVHALDIKGLQHSSISLWGLWWGIELAGCVALKQHDAYNGEIKTMRTANQFRGKGLGKVLLRHILEVAAARHLQRLNLETGSQDFFEPARRLYASVGFQHCGPFADYKEDPNSVFMTLELAAGKLL